MDCIYCKGVVPQDRADIGKKNCFAPECVRKGIVDAQAEYRVVLIPKQGFGIVHKDSDELKYGRSSGR